MTMKERLAQAAQDARAANEKAANDLTQQIAEADRKAYEAAVRTIELWLDAAEQIVTEHMGRRPTPYQFLGISPLLDVGRFVKVQENPTKEIVRSEMQDEGIELLGSQQFDHLNAQKALTDDRLSAKLQELSEAGVKVSIKQDASKRFSFLFFDYRGL